MSVRSVLQMIVLGATFAIGLSAAQAETWNLYSDWNITSAADNTANSRWQFLGVTEGANTGYSLLNTYFKERPYSGFNQLTGSAAYPAIGQNPSYTDGLFSSPDLTRAAVYGWKNLDATTTIVNLDYYLHKTSTSGNGITYALYETGGSTPLASGTITGTSPVNGSLTNISVASGAMLYFQVGPNYKGGSTDNYYDENICNLTVTSTPEPSAMMLLASGLVGLLCYAWRKRR
jgi:hypothetical protein